jgi:hypothetical protein
LRKKGGFHSRRELSALFFAGMSENEHAFNEK